MARQEFKRNVLRAGVGLICATAFAFDAAASAEPDPAPGAKQNAAFGFLRIDRYWYGITSNRFWDFDASIGQMIAEDTTVSICRRNDGSAPTLGASTIAFGTPANRLTADRISVQLGATRIISVDTVDGDIHCAGQVAEPTLFGNAFE